jgi:hypothetical protein
MPRFAGPMTATFRLATPARSACDGTRTKVAELTELMTECLASMLPFGKSLSHKSGPTIPCVLYTHGIGPPKDSATIVHFHVARPLGMVF